MEFYVKRSAKAATQFVQDFLSIKTEVGGGMYPNAAALWGFLLAIQDAHDVGGDLLEIGAYEGWGSYLPARFRRANEKLVLVDVSEHYLGVSKQFLVAQGVAALSDVETILVDSATGQGLSHALESSRRFRWIHIDGEHSYAAVFADLDSAARHASSDAIICLDDVDYPPAPMINDAMRDWLAANKTWRLLIRGFNKAYLISSRSRVNWSAYIDFLPEVLQRFFAVRVMLASQSQSADTLYYSYSDPHESAKYQRVRATLDDLESFEGTGPRAFLLGESRRPKILVFGDRQMRVLHGALVSAAAQSGLDLHFDYVEDADELQEPDAERLRSSAGTAIGLVCQHVAGAGSLVTTDELKHLVRSPMVVGVPAMLCGAYWPNYVDLQMTLGSAQCTPIDAVVYSAVLAGRSDGEIEELLSSFDLYSGDEVVAWAARSIEDLRIREEHAEVHVRLSAYVSEHLRASRLYFARSHPGKQVFDFALRGLLLEIAKVFEPRRADVFDRIVAGEIAISYDMSMIDFTDVPPLRSVSRALGLPVGKGAAYASKYVRPRGTYEIHRAISILEEIRSIREGLRLISCEQKAFNLERIAGNTLRARS